MNAATQNWLLALASMVCGVILTMAGQTEAGMLLLGAAVGVITGGKVAKKEAAGLLLCFLLPLGAMSCSPGKAYVEADRLTYEALRPAHEAYIEKDTSLSGEQKLRHIRTLDAWGVRIDKAGGGR